MKERLAIRRTGAWLIPGLSVATPAAAAVSVPDFLSDFNAATYFNFTTFNWPTMLLAASVGLLIVALVAKMVMAARPSHEAESAHADEGYWRRIGNMPAEPPEAEATRRSVESDRDVHRGVGGSLHPV